MEASVDHRRREHEREIGDRALPGRRHPLSRHRSRQRRKRTAGSHNPYAATRWTRAASHRTVCRQWENLGIVGRHLFQGGTMTITSKARNILIAAFIFVAAFLFTASAASQTQANNGAMAMHSAAPCDEPA